MTNEQEKFLMEFADKGIAEQNEIITRNSSITKEAVVQAARAELLASLEVKAKTLISAGLDDFEVNVKPTL